MVILISLILKIIRVILKSGAQKIYGGAGEIENMKLMLQVVKEKLCQLIGCHLIMK